MSIITPIQQPCPAIQTPPVESVKSAYFLSPEEDAAFKAFIESRNYVYQAQFTELPIAESYEKSPQPLGGSFEFRLLDFLPLLISRLQEKAGVQVTGVFVKGGAVHNPNGRLADLDLCLEVDGKADWKKIETEFSNALDEHLGIWKKAFFTPDREFQVEYWWRGNLLYWNKDRNALPLPLSKGSLLTRKLVSNKENKYALYTVPTYIGGQRQPVDFQIIRKAKARALLSSDAKQIDLMGYLQNPAANIRYRIADGYTDEEACLLRSQQQFTISPEKIKESLFGMWSYCRTITRGMKPNHPQIEPLFFAKFVEEMRDLKVIEKLVDYLETHFENDPHGKVIYLLNLEGIISRCKTKGNEIHEKLHHDIRHYLCALLGCNIAHFAPDELTQFCESAAAYLYLRSSNTPPSNRISLFSVNQEESKHWLFASIPSQEHEFFTNPSGKLLNNLLLLKLLTLFPHKEVDLEAVFRRGAPPKPSYAAKVPVTTATELPPAYTPPKKTSPPPKYEAKQSPEEEALQTIKYAIFHPTAESIENALKALQTHPETALELVPNLLRAARDKAPALAWQLFKTDEVQRCIKPKLFKEFFDRRLLDHAEMPKAIELYRQFVQRNDSFEEGLKLLSLYTEKDRSAIPQFLSLAKEKNLSRSQPFFLEVLTKTKAIEGVSSIPPSIVSDYLSIAGDKMAKALYPEMKKTMKEAEGEAAREYLPLYTQFMDALLPAGADLQSGVSKMVAILAQEPNYDKPTSRTAIRVLAEHPETLKRLLTKEEVAQFVEILKQAHLGIECQAALCGKAAPAKKTRAAKPQKGAKVPEIDIETLLPRLTSLKCTSQNVIQFFDYLEKNKMAPEESAKAFKGILDFIKRKPRLETMQTICERLEKLEKKMKLPLEFYECYTHALRALPPSDQTCRRIVETLSSGLKRKVVHSFTLELVNISALFLAEQPMGHPFVLELLKAAENHLHHLDFLKFLISVFAAKELVAPVVKNKQAEEWVKSMLHAFERIYKTLKKKETPEVMKIPMLCIMLTQIGELGIALIKEDTCDHDSQAIVNLTRFARQIAEFGDPSIHQVLLKTMVQFQEKPILGMAESFRYELLRIFGLSEVTDAQINAGDPADLYQAAKVAPPSVAVRCLFTAGNKTPETNSLMPMIDELAVKRNLIRDLISLYEKNNQWFEAGRLWLVANEPRKALEAFAHFDESPTEPISLPVYESKAWAFLNNPEKELRALFRYIGHLLQVHFGGKPPLELQRMPIDEAAERAAIQSEDLKLFYLWGASSLQAAEIASDEKGKEYHLEKARKYLEGCVKSIRKKLHS
jgi:hypothetical protein